MTPTPVRPDRLTEAEWKALVTRIREGEVKALRFRARVFVDAPNSAKYRPAPGQLARIAAGARGALYLVDHGHDVEDRIGTVAGGSVASHEGVDALVLDIDVTDPVAQERFLRGLSDRFSIAWSSERSECCICGSPAAVYRSTITTSCNHTPGEFYDGRECEVWCYGAQLREVSDVTFPAVPSTAVLSAPSPRRSTPAAATPGARPEGSDMSKRAEIARLKAEIARLEGRTPAAPPRYSPTDDEPDVLALAKRLIGRGISKENCTLKRLGELGYFDLTIVEND